MTTFEYHLTFFSTKKRLN